ncbi:Ubiquitin-like-specific protease [Actinidia chinensis var. chinensis]|uniref:Ubiquitin-like-specific protease n=1 Tax=Actinidia chinensis var. chinensis TaxID=1590841 RepID=A0A2R6Q3Q9_ACTCC|nr:Ubiquitin-like-specific protease [Actinidia chinensis var. chinensis]
MGALTSNRKRGDDHYSLNYRFTVLNSPRSDSRIDTHISKKPKTSSSMQTSSGQPLSSRSAASRIHRYPEPVNRITREVHAPCSLPKFRFWGGSNREARPKSSRVEQEEDLTDVMGNALSFRYNQAKNCAIGALRYFKKDKEVIDVDSESDKGDVLDDLSIQEVEVVEDGREWRSVISNQRSLEISGFEPNVPEVGGKVVDHKLQPSSSSVVSDLTNANLKMESAGKMLDSLSPDGELDVFGMSIHKMLQETADKRNPKLSSLNFQIELAKKRLSEIQLLRSVKRPVDEDVLKDLLREPFVPLTKEEEAEVSRALSNSSRRKVLVTHENSNIQITGEVLQCLKPGAWLNDEVINLYLELLKEREKREPKKFLKCHFFNTFFYKKLIGGRNGYDFKSVRRWTGQRKLGYCLLECDKIFVPIHKEVHWCLAVINKKDEKFQYLDSLRGIDSHVLKVLARYVVDEVKDKNGEDMDVSSWQQEYVQDLPEQENGCVRLWHVHDQICRFL